MCHSITEAAQRDKDVIFTPDVGEKVSPITPWSRYVFGPRQSRCSGRYNAAAQFVALLYVEYFGEQDPVAADAITKWAQQQMDYLLGANPLGKSYMMGFTDTFALQPHHPAGHGSMTGQPDDPPENLHISLLGSGNSSPSKQKRLP